jgi:predicted transcriptional regulator
MPTSTTSLKLDKDLKERVQAIARARRRAPHWIMREAIEQFVEREEKRDQFFKDGQAAWNQYKVTGWHASSAEVDAWLAKLEAGEQAEAPECHL